MPTAGEAPIAHAVRIPQSLSSATGSRQWSQSGSRPPDARQRKDAAALRHVLRSGFGGQVRLTDDPANSILDFSSTKAPMGAPLSLVHGASPIRRSLIPEDKTHLVRFISGMARWLSPCTDCLVFRRETQGARPLGFRSRADNRKDKCFDDPFSSISIVLWVFPLCLAAQSPVNYDIVYVRAKRAGDTTRVALPEVKDPIQMEPGADLILLHPDGSEEVLVVGGNGAVVDPVVSFDAQWVYYAKFHDQRTATLNYRAARCVARRRRHLQDPSRNTTNRSTEPSRSGHRTPPLPIGPTITSPPAPRALTTSAMAFSTWVPASSGGGVMFTSSRNGYLPNKDYTFPNMRCT